MSFAVHTRTQPGVTGLDATIYTLDDGAGGRAEIWPALGFNCFHWQAVVDGRALDLLYADPNLFTDGRPTRSGIPILFPFPNRIRGGRFSWEGKDYQLPLTDTIHGNAIHGFACRRPWRVVGQGADANAAWVTGEFRGAKDAKDCAVLWPADYQLRICYRLGGNCLRVEAEVVNPDKVTLPFGLGYHPYYRLPFVAGAAPADCTMSVPARSYWELTNCVPTGQRLPVNAGRDLNAMRRFLDLSLDDVLTDLPAEAPGSDGLIERAKLVGAPETEMTLHCSPDFREMVLFTPGHREAFCVEPYTCTTDAVNLQQQGIDAGWRSLPPGGRWTGIFEMRV
jgi:aldose 1-epimerase